jgi:site-specific DNA-methyltransferase (adenine-specific)
LEIGNKSELETMDSDTTETRSNINLHLGDSLEAMRLMPDNAYDLAIVDPPYGIGIVEQLRKSVESKSSMYQNKNGIKGSSEWDNSIPQKEYFEELFRVSKNQIIWGGNYFIEHLKNTRCFLIWDKQNGTNNMADAELAWASFKTSVRMYRGHIFKGIGNTNYNPIHPTQKPVALYEWLLKNYAKEGDKILDTHGGSMSIAIACHNLKFDLDLWELDPDYYAAGVKRFEQHKKQLQLF